MARSGADYVNQANAVCVTEINVISPGGAFRLVLSNGRKRPSRFVLKLPFAAGGRLGGAGRNQNGCS